MTLESIIGKERVHTLADNKAYRWTVDTVSQTSFYFPIGVFNEMVLGGMAFEQSMKARGLSFLVNACTARPMGIFRDYVWQKLETTEESGFWKRAGTDIVAGLPWVPIYAGIIATAGGDRRAIYTGIATVVATIAFASRPAGWWMDKSRKYCGMKSAAEITEEKMLQQEIAGDGYIADAKAETVYAAEE